MQKNRGFTLVELMIVVAIIGIIAAMAMISFGQNRSRYQVDNWAAVNRDAILTASRRAISTHNTYMVVFGQTNVQWCQVLVPTSNTCAGQGTAAEAGRLIDVTLQDVESLKFATSADTLDANGNYVAAGQTTLGSGVLYLGRNGSASTTYANVQSVGLPLPTNLGFTLYIRRKTVDAQDLHRKVVVYGLTTKTRIFPSW